MDGAIDIRRYEERDAAALRALFVRVNRLLAPPPLAAAFEDYIERSLAEEIDRIPEYYGARQGSFWVARVDGKLFGMFGLEAAGDGAMELRRMYVDPDVRRRGVARAMLAFAEDEARRAGAREMVLSTSEIQKEALALYCNAGYRQAREEIAADASNKAIGGGIRRFHFSKTL
ncbi:MAG TPA: GNAT family N-acetyltransferase [Pseudolabrys sp.]